MKSTRILTHDGMVVMMLRHFEDRRYSDLRVLRAGYRFPDTIVGPWGPYDPDITCRNPKGGVPLILKAHASLQDGHLESQWMTLNWYANKIGADFHLAMPHSKTKLARNILKGIGITRPVKIWSPL